MTLLLAAVLVCLAWPKPAYAYIDPALGSMILQAALAAITALGSFFVTSASRSCRCSVDGIRARQSRIEFQQPGSRPWLLP